MDIEKGLSYKSFLLVIFVLIVTGISNEAYAKKLFDNAVFTGKVKHKKPYGPGTLILNFATCSREEVEIKGIFSNDTIYEGSLWGLKGVFTYSLEKSEKIPIENPRQWRCSIYIFPGTKNKIGRRNYRC